MGNMFEKAKATEVTKPKAKGKSKPQIDVEGLREYAALKYALNMIDTVVKELKGAVDGTALKRSSYHVALNRSKVSMATQPPVSSCANGQHVPL